MEKRGFFSVFAQIYRFKLKHWKMRDHPKLKSRKGSSINFFSPLKSKTGQTMFYTKTLLHIDRFFATEKAKYQ